MPLPEKVKVLATKFEVKYPYKFSENTDLNGQIDYEMQEIRLRGVTSGGLQRPYSDVVETLFHEIMHAVECKTYRKIFKTEGDLSAFSDCLYAVLVDTGMLSEELLTP